MSTKFNPDVCKIPQMNGAKVASEESISKIIRGDLNLDGKQDEYFAVRQKSDTHCGRIPDEAIIKELVNNFGSYNEKKRTGKGVMLIGPMWRSTITRTKNSTTIVTRVAQPIISAAEKPTFRVKHLNRKLKLYDPVAIGDGKTYFVIGLDFSKAVTWDGSNKASVNYGHVRLSLVPKDVMMKILSKKGRPRPEDIKLVSFKDIKAVMSRGAFPELYKLLYEL